MKDRIIFMGQQIIIIIDWESKIKKNMKKIFLQTNIGNIMIYTTIKIY